jgi:glutaredoxin
MPEKVLIYGKPLCPHTQAARDDYEKRGIPYEYHDVKAEPQAFAEMMSLSRGNKVPVIVEDGRVTVGFGGT